MTSSDGRDITPLTDSYKRRIDYLRISVTDRCNLKCIYCIPEKGVEYFKKDDILTSAEISRFVGIAVRHGLGKVRITGGEPLVRKDIVELAASIKRAGVQDLSITTNGMMLSKLAEPLKRAGVNRVNISLDTLDADKYRKITRSGDISRIWAAIVKAEKLGLSPIKINVVPIRGVNDDEIVDFASLTFKKDFHIRFIEYMPFGRTKICNKEASVKKDEIMQKVATLGELQPLEFKGRGPSRNYRIKGARGVVGFISPMSDCFCESCNRLRLSAHGKLRPCLFSDIEIDIRTPLRSGATDEELEELLRGTVRAKPEGISTGRKEKMASTVLSSMSKIGG